ncbi:hypothetical protein Haur_2241 [Herpetosiphon aurantiacus DSM 785]|uniref:Uncharacterized protein n=2 Tax=Herpetosiphon TaxID=64 RepID=A9AX73_HERA2|nr:hypothetical protein Haur_2241 [Herpetosiphon aurantiacus DSM 785]
MRMVNVTKNNRWSLLIARILNALSFGLSLMLFYPSLQSNQLYTVLGLVVAIGMLWLTKRLTSNPAEYQARGIYLHVALVLSLLVIGFGFGFSNLLLLGGSLIWAVVGLVDGAIRLRKQA